MKAEDHRKAGDSLELTINDVKYTFQWCPPGTFQMGSPQNEKNRYDNETQHQVTLSRGFWMLETEVTQDMWESVMGNNPSNFKGVNFRWKRYHGMIVRSTSKN
jgi:formylglycine-generating enzyme required for sulfatase activity